MHTRRTSDYSPHFPSPVKGIPNSPEYNAAVNARREMLKTFENRTPHSQRPRRKTWEQRMELRAKNFKVKA